MFASLLAAAALASAGQANQNPLADPAVLHENALRITAQLKRRFDDSLPDFPSTRFRDVHARLVHSVYSDDEGQANRVPWTHRGGLVLVICGQINAKNRMGGYAGWSSFAFEPAQDDVVSVYKRNYNEWKQAVGKPFLGEENLADAPKLLIGQEDFEAERVALLCVSSQADERTDAEELSDLLKP
jgi:hypothetical protein